MTITPYLWGVGVIGGGAAGIAVGDRILKRQTHLPVGLAEPRDSPRPPPPRPARLPL